ncbi:hypothetical protein, partial [Haloarcula sp. CGMCC 1.6347]|uniref:hypothetical protein n=1 Tax=Haloarcula sp. CGMCC 1.6347 TaxID=3111455 RepID=UPI00300EF248
FPDDEQARQEFLSGSDSYDGDGTENDNSNSDFDIIEGDDIGGDNSLDSNQSAAEDFAERVASGEIDGHAPDSEVNAVLVDGDPVAVAATEQEIEDAGGAVYTTQSGGSGPSMPSLPSLSSLSLPSTGGSTLPTGSVAAAAVAAVALVAALAGGDA